jgi:phosphotriesterase-related protein
MSVIRTVLGDVAAATIGAVMPHEHLLFDIVPPGATGDRNADLAPEIRFQTDYLSNVNPANAHQQEASVATAELLAYAKAGGSLIVDQSVAGLARDATGLARASRESGVHVVASAGTYTAAFLTDETRALTTPALADRFAGEVAEGLDGTGIRAGLIGEIGCSWPLEPVERRALEAAALAQARTGAGISVHPGRHPDACGQILDILADTGADLSRVVLCHMDRTYPDGCGIRPLLDRGAMVEWDFFGVEQSHYWMDPDVELPTDRGRLRLIRRLLDDGFGDRILMSHDICTRTRLCRWGGHGYGHILTNVVPLMTRTGFSAPEIRALTRDNAVRLLSLRESG